MILHCIRVGTPRPSLAISLPLALSFASYFFVATSRHRTNVCRRIYDMQEDRQKEEDSCYLSTALVTLKNGTIHWSTLLSHRHARVSQYNFIPFFCLHSAHFTTKTFHSPHSPFFVAILLVLVLPFPSLGYTPVHLPFVGIKASLHRFWRPFPVVSTIHAISCAVNVVCTATAAIRASSLLC